MEFRNLTPFSVIPYKMLDKSDHALHVIAMKVGFRLVNTQAGHWQAILLDKSPLPLCFEDVYQAEPGTSQVMQESNLAPFKPACDVIVNATGYAPGGQPCTAFLVSLKLSSLAGETLIDKTLMLTGERRFVRQLTGKWRMSHPELFNSLPLDYRYAFGGEEKIYPDDEIAAHRVPQAYHLTEEMRASHPDPMHLPLAHHVCVSNPLGSGYTEPWFLNATQKTSLVAPRIFNARYPLQGHDFQALAEGTADDNAPVYRPAGMGIIGRSWHPRLEKAGTYDDAWLATRHPYLPDDFDFNYWNGAPEDQQIPFPASALTLELTNLTPDGYLHVTLPHHQPVILLRLKNGLMLPQPMMLDTLIVDMNTLTIAQTWRYVVDTDVPLRVMEARYETRPGTLDSMLFPQIENACGE